MNKNNQELKQILIYKLEQLQKDIFNSTAEIFSMNLSADQKSKISTLKFELLSDSNKLLAEVKRLTEK